MAKYGTTNIEKAVDGLIAVAAEVRRVGADGYQRGDTGLIIRNNDLMNKVADLLDTLQHIGPEAADLDFAEIFGLAGSVVPKIAGLVPR